MVKAAIENSFIVGYPRVSSVIIRRYDKHEILQVNRTGTVAVDPGYIIRPQFGIVQEYQFYHAGLLFNHGETMDYSDNTLQVL